MPHGGQAVGRFSFRCPDRDMRASKEHTPGRILPLRPVVNVPAENSASTARARVPDAVKRRRRLPRECAASGRVRRGKKAKPTHRKECCGGSRPHRPSRLEHRGFEAVLAPLVLAAGEPMPDLARQAQRPAPERVSRAVAVRAWARLGLLVGRGHGADSSAGRPFMAASAASASALASASSRL